MRLRPWRSVECAVFHFWVYVCRRNMLKVKIVKRTLICKHHPIHWLPLCGEPGFDPSSSRALAGLSECQVCPTMVGEFLPLPQCKRGWECFCWNLFWWDPLRTHVFDCGCGAWIGMNDMCGFGTMQPCIVRILDCFGLCLFGLVWNWVQKMKKSRLRQSVTQLCVAMCSVASFPCTVPMVYYTHRHIISKPQSNPFSSSTHIFCGWNISIKHRLQTFHSIVIDCNSNNFCWSWNWGHTETKLEMDLLKLLPMLQDNLLYIN